MGWLLKLKKKTKKTKYVPCCYEGEARYRDYKYLGFLYLTQKICLFLLQIKAFNMGVYGIWFVGDNLKWTLKKLQFGALKT